MKYIFFTGDIHPIGGMQLLVLGKIEVLKKEGWEIFVFFPTKTKGNCVLKPLDEYEKGGFIELSIPPYDWSKKTRKTILDKMCSIVGEIKDNERVIVESHSDCVSMWGELLAERMHAKHILFLCNEIYRGKGKYYDEKLDFFDFKHRRRELAGEMEDITEKLFEGYKKVSKNECYIFKYDENPVRDVESAEIDRIEKADYNICYIGRIEKGYVPNIIEGIVRFAKKHPEARIQVIFVGNIEARISVKKDLELVPNIVIKELGDVAPIPKRLFTKLDVVIAGSGSAKCAAYEGVYTIIADASNFMANGVLGYDTNDELYHSKVNQMTFEKALEEVLVERKYDNCKSKLNKYLSPEECTKQNFELISNSVMTAEYYTDDRMCIAEKNYKLAVRCRLYWWMYCNTPRLLRLIRKNS